MRPASVARAAVSCHIALKQVARWTARVCDRRSQSDCRQGQWRDDRGMAKRTTAAVWVKGIAELLAAEGLDVANLYAAAGIDPRALEGPSARLQSEKISHLWELAVERSRNPMLALAQPQVVRPASFDVVGYTMMSCADLRGAFERLTRYLLILSDALTMTMADEEDGFRIAFVLFGGDRPIPRQRIEFIFITVISFC